MTYNVLSRTLSFYTTTTTAGAGLRGRPVTVIRHLLKSTEITEECTGVGMGLSLQTYKITNYY